MTSPAIRIPLSLLVAAGIVWWSFALLGQPSGRELSLSLLFGAAFGFVLQRARFCFLCNFRDFVEDRNPSGLIAIIVALAAGVVFYHLVMSAWLPVPQADRFPPNAHIGPAGPVLGLAAFVFGLGMAISGSCLSAHFYRLGEGSPTSPFALLGAAIGFFVGFQTWNPLFLAGVSEDRAIWLPGSIGYALTIVASLLACALLAAVVLVAARTSRKPDAGEASLGGAVRAVFVERWPPVAAGLAVAAISAFAYFRIAPLGVTAELGSLVRTAGADAGLLPDTLFGLDTLRGCATVVKEALLSRNGVFVAGLVLASFAAALAAGQFKPQVPTLAQAGKGLFGGALMGWGAMTGLGCTVGVLLSGIHAGALSGWIFLAFCTAGIFAGLKAMKALGW